MRRHIKLFMKVAKISNVNLVENHFTQADFLRRHKIIHEGQKDFKCNSCGKLFTHVGDMKKHIKTVTMIDLRKLSVITSKPFMKATKISNVTLVENHLLFCQT